MRISATTGCKRQLVMAAKVGQTGIERAEQHSIFTHLVEIHKEETLEGVEYPTKLTQLLGFVRGDVGQREDVLQHSRQGGIDN